jgi:hypothetical protein
MKALLRLYCGYLKIVPAVDACRPTALLLLYYCCTTALLLLYSCFTPYQYLKIVRAVDACGLACSQALLPHALDGPAYRTGVCAPAHVTAQRRRHGMYFARDYL